MAHDPWLLVAPEPAPGESPLAIGAGARDAGVGGSGVARAGACTASPGLSGRIRDWIEEAKAGHPEALIRGGDAIMPCGDIGRAAHLRPDGVIPTAARADDGEPEAETDPGRHLDETGERP